MRLSVPEFSRPSNADGQELESVLTAALFKGVRTRSLTDFQDFLLNNGIETNKVVETLSSIIKRVAEGEEVRAVISAPPRHGKTDTMLHAIVWLLRALPHKVHAYTTYGQNLANSKSRRARNLALDNGVTLDPAASGVSEWLTKAGGGLLATGAGGPLTGKGITGLGVIDDPFKNRQEAESSLIRERVWEWYTDVFYTRLEPGSSVIVMATRWHLDDLSGRLIKEGGWEVVNLPAISEDNTALWPARYSIDRLESIRQQIGEYSFQSLYQGEPRPRGDTVFKNHRFYTEFPSGGFQEGAGFDAAYTAKTHADYSVTIRGRMYDDVLYITDMIRGQHEPAQYISILKARGVQEVTWYIGGTEKGLVDFLWDQGIAVNTIPAKTDKFVRAQPAAAAWNVGKVLLPHPDERQASHGLTNLEWVYEIIDELSIFTGVNDAHDDIVDALAALHYDLSDTLEVFAI